MNSTFEAIIASFEPKLQQLTAMPLCDPLALPADAPIAGVYVLFENEKPLYVGRSNRLRKRLGNHCREGATHKMAAFAFRLARIETGNLKATYRPEGSRSALMNDPTFAHAFHEAKSRIRRMRVRYVAEAEPTHQALLEIYVAIAMKTPFNDFDTH